MIVALFGFLFAMFRELSEHAKEGNFDGYPDWWNTPKSWVNKHEWSLPLLPEWLNRWLFNSPLVWLTDAEHFFQFFSMLSVVSGIWILAGWQYALVFYLGNLLAGAVKGFTDLR